jgi:hypothetical protein
MNTIKQPLLPDTVHFNHTIGNDQTEVMRISRDGVWVNPNMPVDDAAKAVLAALGSHIKMLVESAERERKPWIGLTDEEFVELCGADLGTAALIRAVEAKLKEKNDTTPPAPAQPLTQQEVVDGFCKLPHEVQFVSVFNAGVRFAEAAHGITKKGGA